MNTPTIVSVRAYTGGKQFNEGAVVGNEEPHPQRDTFGGQSPVSYPRFVVGVGISHPQRISLAVSPSHLLLVVAHTVPRILENEMTKTRCNAGLLEHT